MTAPEANEQWLTAILDTIDEGIHAVDVDGVTIFYNGAAARMDGLAPRDVIGKHVLSVFPSLGQDTSTLLQVLRSGRAIQNRAQTYTNYLGVTVHTVNTTLPIRVAGQTVGALEIAKDLTQVRNLSEQVLALQAQVVDGGRKRRGRRREDLVSPKATYTFADILTQDPRMLSLKQRALRAAETSSPILVYGETGTGKELLVQAIHNASPRSHRPFLAVNCAALPGSLLEGILFGTVRGSFTGAEDRPGMFELADGGTLFLDEIQSMPLELQAKLLRALQEGEIMRVGDTRIRRLSVRVIAAMNQIPEAAATAGQIRQDLYYRINVVRLDIPPLRERQADIPYLTQHLIAKWNNRFGTRVSGVTPAVAHLFSTYPWPGNVRELENAIEAAMNLVTVGEIDWDSLPAHLRERRDAQANGASGSQGEARSQGDVRSQVDRRESAAPPHTVVPGEAEAPYPWVAPLVAAGMDHLWERLAPQSSPQSLDAAAPSWPHVQSALERMVIARALEQSAGNVSRAAARLGLPRQTLQYRIRQFGL
ncbi:sigma 54-interacting transcriptional regulator [Alicyclobacillus cycloheptanicus]|uniref:Arginine utilization regulatory protein n=1 Tax=Alicyclobacillus cycloheptanicus TaxID=1457 RepID=A0ABT9XGQ1_9BACL|nr:sigma 54-interacting transcriptional regulator [Alicyclobacillus cycloheptanicus]MDQ0189474.1 arginine utilization regulatory protein [Alicyclobacillus cycloheptanicus]WDM02340.1 sigma 54-interacting transcriptional regulator [Alicyclobacillus cycloheptanicus]